MVVIAVIYGHPVRVLIDSGATRRFFYFSDVLPLRLQIVKDCIFYDLGDGQKSSRSVKS